MILQQKETTNIRTSEKFKELEFGIRSSDMGLVLEILRSKLYRNPIAAICREVASNARDANREAENTAPIEISIDDGLFSAGDLTISFKDVGPGISPERMADVFVNYGASTKRTDNIQTGGFGIGAKTPFSYTDNFTIITIVNNIKYTYMAAIEEGNCGKIYLVTDEETVEPNGTTIIIPIKSQDRTSFEQEVYRATIFWSMRPIYKNFRIKGNDVVPSVIHEDDHFLIAKTELLSDSFGLLLDGIFYGIDPSIMRFAYSNHGALVVFKFGIGDLTISANRENVQYDDTTKTAINKRFVELINLAKEKYETEFRKMTTWLEANIFHQKNDESVFYKIVSHHSQSSDPWFATVNNFKGVPLSKNLQKTFPVLGFYRCEKDHRDRMSRTKVSELNPELVKLPMYFFDDTASFVPLKDATILSQHKAFLAVRVDAKLLKWSTLPFKQKKENVKVMRQFLNDIKHLKEYGFTYTLYSKVEKMKVVKVKSNETVTPKIHRVDSLKVFMHPAGAHISQRNKQGSYCYLKIDGTTVTSESGMPLESGKYALYLVDDILQIPNNIGIDDMFKIAINNNFIPGFHIVFANKKRGTKLVGLLPLVSEKLEMLTDDIISRMIDRHHVRAMIEDYKYLLKINYVSKEFSETAATLASIVTAARDNLHVPDYLVERYKHLSKMNGLHTTFQRIKDMTPMLKLVGEYSARNNLGDITTYINLVENDAIAKGTLTKK